MADERLPGPHSRRLFLRFAANLAVRPDGRGVWRLDLPRHSLATLVLSAE